MRGGGNHDVNSGHVAAGEQIRKDCDDVDGKKKISKARDRERCL